MARYKLLDGQGRIVNIIEADAEFASQVGAVPAEDGDAIYSEPVEQTPDDLIKYYDGVVQGHIDAVARSFGYGDPNRPEVSPILHAISYAEEPAVPRFQIEGRALRAWRSIVWATAAGILNAVMDGQRQIPTEAELLAELPPAPVQEPLPT